MRIVVGALAMLTAAALILVAAERRAEACGCLSPPEPVDDEEFAVNQQAEQIIFEVEENHVVAHVLIKYAGEPEKFAWIVPVPTVPELSLSSTAAFGVLDRETAPQVGVRTVDVCPDQEWVCRQHPYPTCPQPGDDDDDWGAVDASGAVSDAGVGNDPPPGVDVIDQQTIGSYETIVFSAGDMSAAVAWLQGEGFIVNDTMAPFMQPYADGGMLFVASKLVPGADVSEIRPLRIRYEGEHPMIPLRLTAVAAEPHMTITAYIYGYAYYGPMDNPLIDLDAALISRDRDGRVNYPMALARTIDEAGGDGFIAEYMGDTPVPDFDQGTGCCNSEWDQCGIQWDGICSCPGDPNDAEDCGDQTDLLEGIALIEELAAKHPRLTRLTTRLSPEEMTRDPMFDALPPSTVGRGRLALTGETNSLAACESAILEPGRYQRAEERQACAAVYCGAGECVTTSAGAACLCDAGYVARLFTDLDGATSVTCVPEEPPVDLEAGGLVLPDACASADCGAGSCVDLNGVASCACDAGAAAAPGTSPLVPSCRAIEQRTGTPGAGDFSAELEELRVCAPPPPASCGEFGWLEQVAVERQGEACSAPPDPARLIPPDPPTCEDLGFGSDDDGIWGCGCRAGDAGSAFGLLFLAAGTLLLVRGRRRRVS